MLLSTAVIPIYAKSLMPADGNIVSAWGYAQTIASLVIALLMPLLGSIADVQGMKIKFFLGFFGTGVVTCCAMALPLTWLPFLVVYILATIGLNGSLTFYDSMLIDTTSNERMDKVSSHGYGWGYFYIILFQTSTNKSHKNKQALKIDRTIRPQRPLDSAPTTA